MTQAGQSAVNREDHGFADAHEEGHEEARPDYRRPLLRSHGALSALVQKSGDTQPPL